MKYNTEKMAKHQVGIAKHKFESKHDWADDEETSCSHCKYDRYKDEKTEYCWQHRQKKLAKYEGKEII